MTSVPQEVEDRIRAAVLPARTEIVRAKRLILSLMKDGDVIGIGRLQRVLTEAESIREPVGQERLTMQSPNDFSKEDLRSQPLIARFRLALAACEAVVELAAQGLIVEASGAPYRSKHAVIVGGDPTISVGLQYRNLGTSVAVGTRVPRFADGYRILPRLLDSEVPWFLDSDLFLEDLSGLQLSARARRCLDEALEAYRRGLYLSCVNLLGTASEGAWFTAGSRLSSISEKLEKAISGEDVQALTVRNRVVEVLTQTTPSRKLVPGLESTAELLRRLRNYGLHPKDEESDLERYLTEEVAGALLLEAHSYLVTLGRAVDTRLEQDN